MHILFKEINIVNYSNPILSESDKYYPDDMCCSAAVFWDQALPKDGEIASYKYSTIDYYKYFFQIINSLFDFLLDNKQVLLEKHFVSLDALDMECLVSSYLVNNIKFDGLIYVSKCGFVYGSEPKNAYGTIGANPGAPYSGHQELIEFFHREQEKRANDGDGYKCFLTFKPTDLLDEFILCFEEHIAADIPADNFLWRTPFLIGVMHKFVALKEYRKTLS